MHYVFPINQSIRCSLQLHVCRSDFVASSNHTKLSCFFQSKVLLAHAGQARIRHFHQGRGGRFQVILISFFPSTYFTEGVQLLLDGVSLPVFLRNLIATSDFSEGWGGVRTIVPLWICACRHHKCKSCNIHIMLDVFEKFDHIVLLLELYLTEFIAIHPYSVINLQ